MATLYEIDNLLKNFEFEIDEETGEILNYDDLENIEMERNSKIENIALWIKNLKSDAEAYKNEKMAFAKRQQFAENKVESLKNYLEFILGGEKFKTDRVELSYRKSETVEIDPDGMESLPAEYKRFKVEPDKTALKKALKDGEAFKGVHLVEKNNLQIK